jgi:hypothetical protein
MRVLCLADQKMPAMDKLYYYVMQTDQMLPKYLADAEDRTAIFLTYEAVTAMELLSSAGMAGPCADMEEEEDDNVDDIIDTDDIFNDNYEDSDDKQ